MKNSILFILLVSVSSLNSYAQTVLKPPIKPAIAGQQTILLNSPAVKAITITENSANAADAVRQMKAEKIPVNNACAALKKVLTLTDFTNFKALFENGYTKPDAVKAIREVYSLDTPTKLNTALRQARESIETRAVFLKESFTLSFDDLFTFLHQEAGSLRIFKATLNAYPLSVDQIIQKCYQYYSGRFLTNAAAPAPSPADTYRIIREKDRTLSYFSIWAKLLNVGYQPGEVVNSISIGEIDVTGRGLDEVSRCSQSVGSASLNPVLRITINPNGTTTVSNDSRSCWVLFFTKIKAQGIQRATAREILNGRSVVVCLPEGNNLCSSETERVIDEMLTSAGYLSEKR